MAWHMGNLIGGTLDPIIIDGRTYDPVVLWSGTNVDGSTTYTSDWVDLHQYDMKTAAIYCTASSTLTIQITLTSSTDTAYDYYTDSNVAANTLATKSWTENCYYARIQVTPSEAGTIDAWLVGRG